MAIAQRGEQLSASSSTIMEKLLAPARRLPVGPRADPADARALPDRGGVRGARGDRRRRRRASTATSSATCCSRSSSRRSCAPREGKFGIDDVVARHRHQDDPPPPARLRRCSRSRTPTRCSPTGASSRRPSTRRRASSGGRSTACRWICRRCCARSASARRRRRSASTGPTSPGVRDKVDEELREIDEAVAAAIRAQIEHEVGDLLLAASRLSAKLGVAPEDALRSALRRFQSRFEAIEDRVIARGAQGQRTRRWRSSTASGTR